MAVRHDENAIDTQPHPAFCAVRVRDWERLHGDWSPGFCWEAENGRLTTDVGGNLLRALERSGDSWTPLLRSNRVNLHPLWFGIYGDIVYHHGAGFRWAVGRVDLRDIPACSRHGPSAYRAWVASSDGATRHWRSDTMPGPPPPPSACATRSSPRSSATPSSTGSFFDHGAGPSGSAGGQTLGS